MSFVRPLNVWEMDEAQNFLCLLNSGHVKRKKTDFSRKGTKSANTLLRITWLGWKKFQVG